LTRVEPLITESSRSSGDSAYSTRAETLITEPSGPFCGSPSVVSVCCGALAMPASSHGNLVFPDGNVDNPFCSPASAASRTPWASRAGETPSSASQLDVTRLGLLSAILPDAVSRPRSRTDERRLSTAQKRRWTARRRHTLETSSNFVALLRTGLLPRLAVERRQLSSREIIATLTTPRPRPHAALYHSPLVAFSDQHPRWS